MFKKILGASVLLALSATASAEWVGTVTGTQFQDSIDGVEYRIPAVVGAIGYEYSPTRDVTFEPQLRLGFGLTDDRLVIEDPLIDLQADIELEVFAALTFKMRYFLDRDLYLFATPSYAFTSFKVTTESQSIDADDWEAGLGIGLGYTFGGGLQGEISYEGFGDANAVSIGLKFPFGS